MGRGDHRARARQLRAKAEALGLPPLAKTKTRAAQPRQEGRFVEAQQDARETALQARCRHFGVRDTPDNQKALSGQHSGSALGMVLQATCKPADIPDLWSTWQAWCMAERTYRMRIIGQTGDPKGSTFTLTPEPMETDDGHSVDLRTGEERDADAVRGWMRWRGWIGQLPGGYAKALHGAERGDGPVLWADCRATLAGEVAVLALRALHAAVVR